MLGEHDAIVISVNNQLRHRHSFLRVRFIWESDWSKITYSWGNLVNILLKASLKREYTYNALNPAIPD